MADEDQKRDESPKDQKKQDERGEKGGQVGEDQSGNRDMDQGWGPEATDLENK